MLFKTTPTLNCLRSKVPSNDGLPKTPFKVTETKKFPSRKKSANEIFLYSIPLSVWDYDRLIFIEESLSIAIQISSSSSTSWDIFFEILTSRESQGISDSKFVRLHYGSSSNKKGEWEEHTIGDFYFSSSTRKFRLLCPNGTVSVSFVFQKNDGGWLKACNNEDFCLQISEFKPEKIPTKKQFEFNLISENVTMKPRSAIGLKMKNPFWLEPTNENLAHNVDLFMIKSKIKSQDNVPQCVEDKILLVVPLVNFSTGLLSDMSYTFYENEQGEYIVSLNVTVVAEERSTDSNQNKEQNFICVVVADDVESAMQLASMYYESSCLNEKTPKAREAPLKRIDLLEQDLLCKVGWCSWDAYPNTVTENNLRQVIAQISGLGYLILDDGWQSVHCKEGMKHPVLSSFEPNGKFNNDFSQLKKTCHDQNISLIVWQTVIGYWGGCELATQKIDTIERTSDFSETKSFWNESDIQHWKGTYKVCDRNSLRLFFEEMFQSYARQSIDGLKIDGQNLLSILYNSDPSAYFDYILECHRCISEFSQQNHINTILNCMGCSTVNVLASKVNQRKRLENNVQIFRSSEDHKFPFVEEDEEAICFHIWTNLTVGTWLNQFDVIADWDMFCSGNRFAGISSVLHAINLNPCYISDEPGQHNQRIIDGLVMKNGKRPLPLSYLNIYDTDLWFDNPIQCKKICSVWNENVEGGLVICLMNLYKGKETIASSIMNRHFDDPSNKLYDVVLDEIITNRSPRPLILGYLEYKLYATAPTVYVNGNIELSIFGILGMLNIGGTIKTTTMVSNNSISITLRSSGCLLCWSSISPLKCWTQTRSETAKKPLTFRYDSKCGRLEVDSDCELNDNQIVIEFFVSPK